MKHVCVTVAQWYSTSYICVLCFVYQNEGLLNAVYLLSVTHRICRYAL